MLPSTRHGGWIIWMSFAVALALTITPLPSSIEPFRPDFVVLALIYWCLALPTRTGVFSGFLLGLVLDVTEGVILGLNAAGLTLVAFTANKQHQRIRLYRRWQQMIFVVVVLATVKLLALWVRGIVGLSTPLWQYWMSPLSSALLWPSVYTLLRGLRRRNKLRG